MTWLLRFASVLEGMTEGPWVWVDGEQSHDPEKPQYHIQGLQGEFIMDNEAYYNTAPRPHDAKGLFLLANARNEILAVLRAAEQVKANFMAIDDGFFKGLVPPEFSPLLEPMAKLKAKVEKEVGDG